MLKKTSAIIILSGFYLLSWAQSPKTAPPSGLRCDLVEMTGYRSINGYEVNALASELPDEAVRTVRIASKHPSFSWIMNDANLNAVQTAYQVLLSDNSRLLARDSGDVWNSGKITSAQSAGVVFNGKSLKPNTAYYWKVRTWNARGEVSAYASSRTFFTAAILKDHQPPNYPLQITEEPPSIVEKHDDTYFIDFGRDSFAQLKLLLFSATGNDTVTVRIGEAVNANGRVNRRPPGSVYYGQFSLALRKGLHTYKIKISKNAYNTRPEAIKMPADIGEVAPFRYCEIENYREHLKATDLTRLTIHYHFDDAAANFHCSDSALNAVWDLCKYSIKATSFLGIYVDGNRERTPYEADALINQLSHYAVDNEFTLARNSHEYLITHPTWPTEWILQSVLIAWNDYMYTGDISSAQYYYEDLKAKTLSSLADSTHLISTLNGKMTQEVLDNVHHGSGPLKDIVDWPRASETDGFVFTRYNAVVNAFYFRALRIMEKLSADLGKKADSEMYGRKAAEVDAAYQKMFYDATRKIYVDGDGTGHASLHANVFALALGLVKTEKEREVVDFIISRGMACSVYGSQFLLEGLYSAGKGDQGLQLMTSGSKRSWLNMIRMGSTITMEAWDGQFKPNQDWNHAWGTAPANIICRKLMGIEPLTPGWTSFSIKPQIGSLSNAAIDVPTIKGTIKASYKQTAGSFDMEVEIPANTVAGVYLPLNEQRVFKVKIDGQDTIIKNNGQAGLIKNIGSGKHVINVLYTK